MSITDELREAIGELRVEWIDLAIMGPKPTREDFTAIADRIDIAHKHAIGYVDDRDPETMAENGWVRLPKDANGVPFRIGDKADSDHYEDGTIIGIQYELAANGAIRELVAVQPNGWDVATWRDPEEYAHHHEPTVEDVLEEFVARWMDTHHDDIPALKAEFAAKLRLAEEDA